MKTSLRRIPPLRLVALCAFALTTTACSGESADDGGGATGGGLARDANPDDPPSLEFDVGFGGQPGNGGTASGGGAGGGAGGAAAGGMASGGGATPADAGPTADAAPLPPTTQCNNGEDDDGDGAFDLYDGDCSGEADPTEQGARPPTACGNAVDDDADGAVDFPEDPGCLAAGDGDEEDPAETPQCNDGMDNDGDGHTDFPEDSGCAGRGTIFEGEPRTPTACADGMDNDEDGATDYPEDVDCVAAASRTEAAPGGCGGAHHVLDLNRALAGAEYVDGDTSMGAEGFVGTCGGNAGPEIIYSFRVSEVVGAIEFTTEFPETRVPTVLYVRTACDDPRDVGCNRGSAEVPGTHVRLERPEVGIYYVVVDTSMADQSGAFRLGALTVEAPRCSDARDNDLDGRVDLADPGCVAPEDEDEADPPTPPECADGVDNDADGQTDYPADPTCTAAGITQETEASCALAQNLIMMDAAGGMVHVSTGVLGNSYTSTCGGSATGPEQVIAVVLDRAASVTAETINNSFDTVLHARSVCDDPITQYGCDDDGGGIGAASRLTFAVAGPGVAYIFVDGYSGASGDTDVVVTVQ